ncbi:MAG: hypothetical protein ABI462_00760 [Ignavibacteria bacterium]
MKEEDNIELVTVYSTCNNAIFQIAKNILKSNGIKFFSNAAYYGVISTRVYNSEIKVFPKDIEAAKKLLSELTPSSYEPPNEFQKFLSGNIIYIIAGAIVLIFVILFMVKK